MWQCPSCSKTHGDQFDACWQCGFEREVAKGRVFAAELPRDNQRASQSDLRRGNGRLAGLLVLLAAMLVLAVAEYSLMAGGLEAATVSELALVVAVGCIGLHLLARHASRRWFQYSLRTLLLTVLLASIGMSWLTVRMHGARRQREAVEAITRTGGLAVYDYQQPSTPRPAWRRRLLENELFASVVHLHVHSDAACEHVDALNRIQHLYLEGDDVTNSAMEHLKGLAQLQHLSLTNTRVTDAGLEHLNGLARLRRVMFHNIAVTDAGMKHLEGLAQLEWLYLDRTQVTDAGLVHLTGLTQLQALCVSGRRITDAGLVHLKGLSRVNLLDLQGTQVTDAGLEHLKGMNQLNTLDLRGTRVTDDGVERLQEAFPNCKIQH